MLERMKKILNKEKGFTLVELLAVIAILGIIMAIAIPSVSGLIGSAEEDAHDANADLFKNAARLAHMSDLKFTVDATNDADATYSLKDLAENGFLEKIPNVPGKDNQYKNDSAVSVIEDTNSDSTTFEYEYEDLENVKTN